MRMKQRSVRKEDRQRQEAWTSVRVRVHVRASALAYCVRVCRIVFAQCLLQLVIQLIDHNFLAV